MKKRKIPQKIGSIWVGDKYIHGPRLVDPNLCSEIRLGKPSKKKGVRLVWGKLKSDGWVIQSKLTPKGR